MKRIARIFAIGAALLLVGYFGFPRLFRYLDDREHRRHLPPEITLRNVGRPPSSSLQPGLSFFQDIDEVRFVYSRSFDGGIEITVRRPYLRPKDPPVLDATISQPSKPEAERYIHTEKIISEEIFTELRGFVVRQDLIERSIVEPVGGADGSTWILEGKKGEFAVRHVRWCPQSRGDKVFVAIGKRFLDLAEIKIPDDKFY